MSNLVIVAIPREEDPVWKYSSEKVPHCTLLFLGENTDKANEISAFLQHAVNILDRGPFGLTVDHRGTLGDDEADVLFFRKDWSTSQLEGFRGQLLKNRQIRDAYDSVEQFPVWNPHLTMGYPSSPAKKDDRDYPGFHWVEFDRIALWTGNYEGPEFRLEYRQDTSMEVMMSTVQERGEAAVNEALSHFGVKGMKWGVRRDKQGRSRINPEGHALKTDLIISGAGVVVPILAPATITAQIRLVRALARTATEKTTGYNKDGRWQAGGKKIDLNKNPAKMKEYNEGFKNEVVGPARNKHVKHADASTTNVEFELVRDAMGYIIEVKPKQNNMAQTEKFVEDFLAHYGVKGMKWGVRREHASVSTSQARTVTDKAKVKATGGTGHEAHDDAVKAATVKQKIKKSGTAAASNKELQDLIDRSRLETQAREAVQSKGKKFVKKKLGTQLDQQSQQFVREQIQKKRK